uniref:Mediator of RNA polymerase II transcription subunit 6 n=1 Tax=Caenorhabditis tropicalis TaxID=1561998 RepID=A0A1I7TFJ8_9PELO
MSSTKKRNPLHLTFCNSKVAASEINMSNVLNYFCNPENPFYDLNSVNYLIKAHNIKTLPEKDLLRGMAGIQYILWYSRGTFHVIMKLKRNRTGEVNPLSYYYVIDGVIQQAPDMFSIIQSRLLGSLEPLRNAFGELCNCSRFTIAQGYFWEFKNKKDKKKVVKKEEKHESDEVQEQRSTPFQKINTQTIFRQLVKEMPVDDALERAIEDERCIAGETKSVEPEFKKPKNPTRTHNVPRSNVH